MRTGAWRIPTPAPAAAAACAGRPGGGRARRRRRRRSADRRAGARRRARPAGWRASSLLFAAAEADGGEPPQQADLALLRMLGSAASPRLARSSFWAGRGSSSIRGMRGGRLAVTLRRRRDEGARRRRLRSRCGAGCSGTAKASAGSAGWSRPRPIGRTAAATAALAAVSIASGGLRAPASPAPSACGAWRPFGRSPLGDARAAARPALVGAQLLRELRDPRLRAVAGALEPAWSMPVATTETRMMPSRLSSKVAPTMMLASWSTSSRMRVAASSTS